MIVINYPEPDFRTRGLPGKEEIFDPHRKLWIRLTPEEWVRQNLLKWMTDVKKFPGTMIAVEKEIRLGEMKKRFDILVYNGNHQPWMLVECKAPQIDLSEKVIMQVLRYNMVIPVSFLAITNGRSCFVAERKNNSIGWMDEFPDYPVSI